MFEVKNISKAYHGRPVLNNISFQISSGECMGIAGENGTGKSTLLRILAQTISADSGVILYQGRSIQKDRKFLRQKLGYVPQHSDMIPELTARQQLQLWRSACGTKKEFPDVLAEVLGLHELLDLKIAEMSGGMQQRVSIAMALHNVPEILIMDEATAGLDASYKSALLHWLKSYTQKGGRIVWCSHADDEFNYLCNKVYTISSGKIAIR